jgi:hypothetical protein
VWNWRKPDVKPLPKPERRYRDLNLITSEVTVSGPTEAVFLTRLWDLMLCIADTKRRERANLRKSSWTPPYCYPTDKLVRELFARTEKRLQDHVFAMLWAPLTDPTTGELRSNLHERLNEQTRRYGVRMPNAAGELWTIRMNPERTRFLHIERRGFPLREVGCLPGLRVSMSEKRRVTVRDPQGRAHCPHGPAEVHGDGTPIFFWRGTRVPSYFIPITDLWRKQYPDCEILPVNHPYRPIDARIALTIQNMEIRRAACEIVGWHKILEDLHAVVIDRDEDPTIGELLQVWIPGEVTDIQQQFLRVRCGTGRVFALAVPDTCRTALEANAWTYGLRPEDYKPEIRT